MRDKQTHCSIAWVGAPLKSSHAAASGAKAPPATDPDRKRSFGTWRWAASVPHDPTTQSPDLHSLRLRAIASYHEPPRIPDPIFGVPVVQQEGQLSVPSGIAGVASATTEGSVHGGHAALPVRAVCAAPSHYSGEVSQRRAVPEMRPSTLQLPAVCSWNFRTLSRET